MVTRIKITVCSRKWQKCRTANCEGNRSIIGLMLESHLYAGNQSADQPLSEMQYGVSITDACIDWQTTEQLLREMTSALRQK